LNPWSKKSYGNRSFRNRSHQQRASALPWRGYFTMASAGLLLGVMIAGAIWLWQILHEPQTLPFHDVRISGGQFQHINSGQLRASLRQQIHGGFFSVQLAPLKQSVMTNPWVEDVAIRRIPGILYVTVREHQPVARWNAHHLINAHDQLFLAPADAPVNLPLLTGAETAQALILMHYKEINNLLLPLHLRVQQLSLDQRQTWELVLNNGIAVTIGHDQVLPRVQRLVHWYPQIVNDKAGEVKHLDLRYPNSIAVEFQET
jgi:cell division protein FtsQ